MILIGIVTNVSSGVWAHIPALRAEYGPLSYLGEAGDYSTGDRVAVSSAGSDEYIVLGVVHP